MKKKELETIYRKLETAVSKNGLDVRMPMLLNNRGKYTVAGLTLCYFYIHLGKIKHVSDLICFLRLHHVYNRPHPRHFGMQHGFDFLVHHSIHPKFNRKLLAGEYCLHSIKKAHPSRHRTLTVSCSSFAELKKAYKHHCAVCGSIENEKHLKNENIITRLEKGHCNPLLPLSLKNCIPMCGYCNHVYKNKFVFNKNGIIIKTLKT